MTSTFFGQAAETVSGTVPSGAGTVGVHFTANSACTLQGIWFYSPSGQSLSGLPQRIDLYNYSTQASIASNTSPSWSGAAGSGWVYAAFSSAVSLSSGTDYMAACGDSSGSAVWATYNSSSWASAITSGPVTAPVSDGGQGWYSASAYAFPSSQLANWNWFIDIQVVTPHTAAAPVTVTPVASAASVHGHPAGGAVTVTPADSAAASAFGPHTAAASVTVTPAVSAGGARLLTQAGGLLLNQGGARLLGQGSGAPVARTAAASLTVAPAAAAGASGGALLNQAGGALSDQAGSPLQSQAGGAPAAHAVAASLTVQPAAVAFASVPVPAVFPDKPLGVRAELLVNGSWVDVTGDMDHGPVAIGRGHPDESPTLSPSTLSLPLTNTAARYSPDNVMSDLWPGLLQNTPVRVSIPAQVPYLRLEAGSQDRAYVNDNSNLAIAGSFEARIALRLSDWRGCVLAQKVDGANQSWYWVLNPDATMTFSWYDAGGTQRTAVSPPVPYLAGSMVLVVFLDTTSSTVYFFAGPGQHADDTAGVNYLGGITWGTPGSVRTGPAPLVVGWSANGIAAQVQMLGRVLQFKLYAVSGGNVTALAGADFTAQPAGTTSFTDNQGNLWHLAGGAEVSDRDYRGHFEVSEYPQEEPPYSPAGDTETDALVQLAGGGLLRRYSQRSTPVKSAMYRAVTLQAGQLASVAYWPGEDGAGAAQLGSASGGPGMSINGTPSLAADSSFTASDPLPVLGGAVLSGQVPAYASNGSVVTRFLGKIGTLPGSGYATLLRVSMSGTVRSLYVVAYNDGGLGLIGYDSQGSTVVNTGSVSWVTGGVSGKAYWYSVEAVPVAHGAQYTLATLAPGAPAATTYSVTVTSATAGNATEVTVNPNGFFTDTVAGHFSVQSAQSSLFSLGPALNGWQGEPAGTRFARLCAEEGIACRTRGNLAATTLMGAQTPQTVTQLLQGCADADQGTWYEPRQVLGWGYVTRRAHYGQLPGLQLDYSRDHLSMWASPPTRDDQVIVNDVTYANSGGSSARAYAGPGQPIGGGRMSVLAPKDGGVGTYDQSYPVAVQGDSGLLNLAGWRLHLGTVDQARLPGIVIDLTGRDLAALFWDVLDLDLSQRLTIASPPARLGPDTLTQLAQQVTEELWHRTLTVTVTGVPELPYQVARAGTAHLAPAAASLGGDIAAASGTLLLATPAGNLPWSTNPADYPCNVKVDGEEMTVTGVAGAVPAPPGVRGLTGGGSVQAATVARSVNGVVKSHSNGAAVTMWPPVTAGL